MAETNYKIICNELLAALPQKHRQVIERRFGLAKKRTATLQQIGSDFKITRERVRQIESDGISRLRKTEKTEKATALLAGFRAYLQENGGAKREDLFLNRFSQNPSDKKYVFLLLRLTDGFLRVSEDKMHYDFWVGSSETKNQVKKCVEIVSQELKQENKPMAQKMIFQLVNFANDLFNSSLEIAKNIEIGPLGEIGLTCWPEIKPRGVRDAALLVLKSQNQPLHFKTIADLSNTLGGKGVFASKKVLPQTVHNELIRDSRFVLVGRGLYGLSAWGYAPGTVKDVIKQVLASSQIPLTKKEVLEQVKKQRIVKDNTICLNLADKKTFSKNQEGRYAIRIA